MKRSSNDDVMTSYGHHGHCPTLIIDAKENFFGRSIEHEFMYEMRCTKSIFIFARLEKVKKNQNKNAWMFGLNVRYRGRHIIFFDHTSSTFFIHIFHFVSNSILFWSGYDTVFRVHVSHFTFDACSYVFAFHFLVERTTEHGHSANRNTHTHAHKIEREFVLIRFCLDASLFFFSFNARRRLSIFEFRTTILFCLSGHRSKCVRACVCENRATSRFGSFDAMRWENVNFGCIGRPMFGILYLNVLSLKSAVAAVGMGKGTICGINTNKRTNKFRILLIDRWSELFLPLSNQFHNN